MTSDRFGADAIFWDDVPEGEVVERVQPMVELGVTGLKRTGGYVDEEFLPALRGRKAIQVFKEMALNDSMAGAMLFAIDKLIREVEWKVSPASQDEQGQAAADFLESCMDDMSHSWDDFISEVLTMLPFGWSWHEICYKRRVGPWEKDPTKKSKHTDGLIGWRKIPIRAQETWLRWVFDESGGIKAMVQLSPPHYKTAVIPIEKSLLFRTTIAKGNPEGQSLLRTAYRSWYFKKRLEEYEAIGVERDLAGMPVAKVPAEYLQAQKGTKQYDTVQAFRKMVRGVRRDENEGLVLPQQYDADTKQPLFEFELMSSGGARQFDTTQIIQRYEQRILMSVLADFILIGHQGVGSYSMHTDKTGIFRAALNAITSAIADVLNRHAVPRLFEINGWKLDELPTFEPTNIDPPDLQQLAAFITSTAGAGMQWFPDPELEKFLRDIARLPELSDEAVDYKQELMQQQQAMEFAQGQMGLLGMKQKAEMAAQGYTPEQAEQASQMPNDDMLQAQAGQQQMMQPPPQEDPNAGPQHERDVERMTIEEQREQAAFERDAQRRKWQQEDEDKNFKRDRERSGLQEKEGHAAFRREKEKMALQDRFADRNHKRGIEQTKAKERHMTIQERMAAQKKTQEMKRPTKDTAKKLPAKKKDDNNGKKR